MKLAIMISVVVLPLFSFGAMAGQGAFGYLLAQGEAAEKAGDLQTAMKVYADAKQIGRNNAIDQYVLARRYCDLTYLTNSAAAQKAMVCEALACAEQSVADDPTNATAHVSLAVCYAKSCGYADIRTEMAYSRLFKEEAEKAITLDPSEDTAYYLLGRWNYELARVGWISRAYVRVVYGGLPQASFQEAIRYFKKAVQLAPNRIIHHAGLAMAYRALNEQNLELVELKKCTALKATNPEDGAAQREAEEELARKDIK